MEISAIAMLIILLISAGRLFTAGNFTSKLLAFIESVAAIVVLVSKFV